MTDQEINRAIATHCGWTKSEGGWWTHPILPDNGGMPEPPDYCNDLNAIAEAEKVLNNPQAVKYRLRLAANSDGPNAKFRTVEAAMCHATARQRSEAFLRALGLWKR